jgi:hypothetical protein
MRFVEIKQLIGSPGQAKGKDKMPKAKAGRTQHPLKNKMVGEAKSNARIQHVEDKIIWDGVAGGNKAIAELKSLETNPEKTTIKWDGSPAIVFGRNERGEFVLTDKSGFTAAGYDGKVTSGEDLEKMFLRRGTEAPDEKRKQFASNMRNIWKTFESATPKDFSGYVLGDLLYYTTPSEVDGRLQFTPNTTMYRVDPSSAVGQQIKKSKTGVVIHKSIGLDGKSGPADAGQFQSGALLVMPPVVITRSPKIDVPGLDKLQSKLTSDIDALLNPAPELKLKDFPDTIYKYINSKAKAGTLQTLGQDFIKWIDGNPKITPVKQQRILAHLGQYKGALANMFAFINGVMNIKNLIIKELDSQEAEIEAYTDGERGGEGYVIGSDSKLVNRSKFTKANMNRER